jgi:hypothetical protein
MHESTKERELHALEKIAEAGKCICHELHELRWLLHAFLFPVPRVLQILQIQGDISMAITGIIVGATGTFASSPSAPPGAVEPTGTTRVWTTSDSTNTNLTPSADGTSVAVAVAATAPVGGSFNLTATDSYPDGTSATSGPVAVPFLAAAAPEPTALSVNQVS